MIERREHKRYELPLEVAVATEERKSLESVQLRNISIGGALFELSRDMSVGADLSVDVMDKESRFANALGLDTSDSGPLRFRMDCTVIRSEQLPDRRNALVAVKFGSPLRIRRIRDLAGEPARN
jgi:c-di-GMP-binding flagellar brake protein YcgR